MYLLMELFDDRYFYFLWFILNKTAWGRHVYAIGDDKEAAELSGIRTDRMLVSIYAVAGLVDAIGAGFRLAELVQSHQLVSMKEIWTQ